VTTPALTRDIGRAKRNMRALLGRLLDQAGISFPEWTILAPLDGAAPLTRSELVRRQVNGRVAPGVEARAAVDGLLLRGLLAPADGAQGGVDPDADDGQDPRLVPTAAGEAVYGPARRTVTTITDELLGDLPQADLEATRRTLAEVTRRASARIIFGG
jgi:DNA-binding MarR family transcriptional regulator